MPYRKLSKTILFYSLILNYGLLYEMRATKFTWKQLFASFSLFSSRVKFAKSISAILISLLLINVSSGSSIIPWPHSVSCAVKRETIFKNHSLKNTQCEKYVHYGGRTPGSSTKDTGEDKLLHGLQSQAPADWLGAVQNCSVCVPYLSEWPLGCSWMLQDHKLLQPCFVLFFDVDHF